MGKFVVDCQLFASPSKELDHMTTKDTFEDRSQELDVAIAIIKDVLMSETSQLPNQAGSWDHPDYVSISHNQVLIFAWSSSASRSGPM